MSRQVIETLISRQLHQYNRLRSFLKPDATESPVIAGPVVTISRMAGCCARDLAAALARRLGVQVWGRELVDLIATDKGLRHELVSRLEQGESSQSEAWMQGMLSGRMFLRTDYVVALAQTLKALADSGGAVVVGRGAGFILGDRAQLRLRLVADDASRIATIQDEYEVDRAEAVRRLNELDTRREEYIRAYFGCDVRDVHHYDLVVNSARVPASAIMDSCLKLVAMRQAQAGTAEA